MGIRPFMRDILIALKRPKRRLLIFALRVVLHRGLSLLTVLSAFVPNSNLTGALLCVVNPTQVGMLNMKHCFT